MLEVVVKRVFAYRVEHNGKSASIVTSDPSSIVSLSVGCINFNSQARFIRQWAIDNGFNYFLGSSIINIRAIKVKGAKNAD